MATTDLHARTSSPFLELLHDQIRNEFTASQQYIAIAVYFDDADLPQLAKRFYAQAVEERNHAMMIIRYLIDKNVAITIPGVDAVVTEFADARAHRPRTRTRKARHRSSDRTRPRGTLGG